jgi:hypothetical protein
LDGKPRWGAQKKLTDAAHYWVRGGSSYKEAIEDLRALNAPEDVIADLEKAQQSEDFEVSEENWPAVEMFLRLQTQWRVSFGGLVGLDYVAVKWLFDVYAVDDHKEMLDALMIMERAALSALSEDADGI